MLQVKFDVINERISVTF